MSKRCNECGNLIGRERFDKPGERKKQIVNNVSAIPTWWELRNFSDVSKKIDVSRGTISKYFYDIGDLRDSIIATAIREERLDIVSQAIAMRHPLALAAPESLKTKALDSL